MYRSTGLPGRARTTIKVMVVIKKSITTMRSKIFVVRLANASELRGLVT